MSKRPAPTKSVNTKLQTEAIRRSVFLEQYKTGTVRKIIEFLNLVVERDLVKKLATYAGDEAVEVRVAELRKEIAAVCAEGYRELQTRLEAELVEFGKAEASYDARTLAQAFPFKLSTNAISVPMVREIIKNKPVNGQLVKEWFSLLPRTVAAKVNQQIMLGIAEGEGISEIVRRVRGRREYQYADGVLNGARNEIEAVVRTAVAGVSSNVREETYAANADLIKAVAIVGTLDNRICLACGARDGDQYPVNQGPRPPFHWRCRCTTVPITKSWKELGIKGLKDLPEGTRASMDGQVPGSVTFSEWLEDQSEATQNEVLGVTRSKLYRSGKLKVKDFVDDRSRVLTLAELGK